MLSGNIALDLTDAGGYVCGRILSDLGVEVIKIEPPEGDPGRKQGPFYGDKANPELSFLWSAYNLGKKGITLDLETVEGRELFQRLVRKADFILESFPPGYMERLNLGYAALQQINPRIIYTAISPFGQTGPYAGLKGPDIVAMAMGGFTHLTGDPDRPPLRISFPLAYNMLASTQAALGALAAFHYRQRTGQGQYVDVSAQESVAASLGFVLPLWELNRILAKRVGSCWFRGGGANESRQRVIWQCREGAVAFMAMGGLAGLHSNQSLTRWIDEEGMADEFLRSVDWNGFDPRNVPQEFHDKIENSMGRFFMEHTKKELHEGAQKRGIHLQMVSTFRDIMESEQLKARRFWVNIQHPELKRSITYPGPFIVASKSPIKLKHRAPMLGEHNADVFNRLMKLPDRDTAKTKRQETPDSAIRQHAFEGLKVLDFTRVIAGPLLTQVLSLHGATVVRVESSHFLDRLRMSAPYKDRRAGVNRSGYFSAFNANKYSMTLDLNHPKAAGIIKRLALWCDVVVENFVPGSMEKRGLSYDDLKKIKPDLIMLSTSNQGRGGPYSRWGGFGYTLMALTGVTNLTGWPDRVCSHPFGALSDMICPCLAGTALLGALEYRRRTGKGQHLDMSQYEGTLFYLSPLLAAYATNGHELSRMGNRSPHAAPHGCYPCKGDDRWCVIAVESNEQWSAFCTATGRQELADDARFSRLEHRKENEDELDEIVAAWTGDRTAEEVMKVLQEAGVAAGIVQNPADILEDPQLKHRGHFQVIEHPEMGYHNYEMPPFHLSLTPAELTRPAPCLGQDNEYVCTELLDIKDYDFIQFLHEGVFE